MVSCTWISNKYKRQNLLYDIQTNSLFYDVEISRINKKTF